ncbi:hypothetical protein Taro_024802 [Colocasia esculenta]|uniref:Uncharacterized protein n=1 Tax=Colocasia esculenta TaxID=4460 RepID=A0A843V7R1_COLES|nr:hypothetical protein [Colocasia esculenta]
MGKSAKMPLKDWKLQKTPRRVQNCKKYSDLGETTCKPSRSWRIAWKPLVGPENGTKPLASSKCDRAQSENAVSTT